jgi:hypothetical protein
VNRYVALARRHPHEFMIALTGKTAEHLRDVHGITSAEDWRERSEGKRENAALHVEAHREEP